MLYVIILCGLLSIAYAIWAGRAVLAADAGTARMQEIAGAIQEGATAYLRRQYTTIAIVGVVVFVVVAWLLSIPVAIGFLIGAAERREVADFGVEEFAGFLHPREGWRCQQAKRERYGRCGFERQVH